MATNYPGALDSLTNPTANDTLNSATVPHADQHANANDAIEAIQATLGINPQGGSATVVARLNSIGASQGTGFNYLFSSSTSMTNPGAGKFALNNSNLTLATQIAISTTNNASVVVSGWLDKWAASTNPNKSVVTISSKTDANVFAIYQVTAVSVQSGYYVFSINPVSFNGTFANLADCFVANVRTGDKGDIGVVISETAPTNTAQLWADTSTSNAQVAVFDGGTPSAQITSIKIRRGLASAWTNQVLDSGEIGFETNTGRFKVGNGSTPWSSLAYAKGDIPASPTISSPTLTGTVTMTGATVTGGTISGGSA